MHCQRWLPGEGGRTGLVDVVVNIMVTVPLMGSLEVPALSSMTIDLVVGIWESTSTTLPTTNVRIPRNP